MHNPVELVDALAVSAKASFEEDEASRMTDGEGEHLALLTTQWVRVRCGPVREVEGDYVFERQHKIPSTSRNQTKLHWSMISEPVI